MLNQIGATLGNFAQYYTTTDTYNTTDAAVGFAIVGVILVVLVIAFLLVGIPSIIVSWILYSKAGRPGWTAIVPVYSSVVMAEIAGKPAWMGWTLGGLPILSAIFTSTSNGALNVLGSLLNLGVFILFILVLVEFIKKYKSNVAFWVTYIIIPIVAVFLVKNMEYIGGGTQASASAPGVPQAPVAPAAPTDTPPASPVV